MANYVHAPRDASYVGGNRLMPSQRQYGSSHPRFATDKQVSYLKDLLTKNELYTGEYDRLWKLLEVHEVDVQTPGDGSRMPFSQASAAIDYVKRQVATTSPAVQATPQPAPEQDATPPAAPVAVAYGVYKKDGEVYIVVPNKAGTRSYAKRLVESPSRLTEAGEVVDFEWEFAPRVIWMLSEADRMTLEDARELVIRYGRCLKCRRHLKAARTLQTAADTGQMLGPVCRKYFQA